MKDFNWKGVLPHLGAVLIFLLLTLIYFSPVLDGKDIKQDDAIGSMGWGKDATHGLHPLLYLTGVLCNLFN